MVYKQKTVSVAVRSAIGITLLTALTSVHAVEVFSLKLFDWDNDGLSSDFNFFATPSGNGPNSYAVTAGESGCVNAIDRDLCDPVLFNAGPIDVAVFTTGWNFGGTGIFQPNITGNADAIISGPIDGDSTNNTISFLEFDYGGLFGGTQFFLPPDDLNAIIIEKLVDRGDGSFGLVMRYTSTINDPASPFNNFIAEFRIEGVLATDPGTPNPRIDVDLQLPDGPLQQCNDTNGGANVNVLADTRLFNGAELETLEWFIDDQPAGTGALLSLFVELGSHTILVVATSVTGVIDTASKIVEIVDTVQPVVDIEFIDKMTGEEIEVVNDRKKHRVKINYTATDTCDPSPETSAMATPNFTFDVDSGDTLKIHGKNRKVKKLPTTAIRVDAIATDNAGNRGSTSAILRILGAE